MGKNRLAYFFYYRSFLMQGFLAARTEYVKRTQRGMFDILNLDKKISSGIKRKL